MADAKISALAAVTSVADADETVFAVSGTSNKITAANLRQSMAQVTANTQTASYGLVLTDANKVVEMDVASANTLTVPLHATQAFPIGTVIEIFQVGAGQTTIVATGGVTIVSPDSKLKLTGQYSSASLRKRGTNAWALIGDLAA